MKRFIEQPILRMMNRVMARYQTLSPVMKGLVAFFMHAWPGQLSCEEFDKFMADFIDGNLEKTVEAKMYSHLRVCPMCRRHHHDYEQTVKATRELFRADSEEDAPQDLVNAILVAMARDEKKDD